MREIIIEEAISWLGTPWVHQACLKKGGVDCINFIAACGRVTGYDLAFPKTYRRRPVDNSLQRYLESHFKPVLIPRRADILLFRFDNVPHHVGLYLGEDKFIHALDRKRNGGVRIDDLAQHAYWSSKIVRYYDVLSYKIK